MQDGCAVLLCVIGVVSGAMWSGFARETLEILMQFGLIALAFWRSIANSEDCATDTSRCFGRCFLKPFFASFRFQFRQALRACPFLLENLQAAVFQSGREIGIIRFVAVKESRFLGFGGGSSYRSSFAARRTGTHDATPFINGSIIALRLALQIDILSATVCPGGMRDPVCCWIRIVVFLRVLSTFFSFTVTPQRSTSLGRYRFWGGTTSMTVPCG